MPRNVLRLSIVAAALLAAGVARAATVTSNITVTATVNKTCTVVTTNIPFGAYDPVSSPNPTSTAGTVTVTCTKGTSWSVDLSQGGGYGKDGTFTTNRAMVNLTDATKFLAYDLYTDAGYSTQWAAAGASGVSTGKAVSTTATIYAKIQDADPYYGDYTDTVVATVNF